MTHPVDVVLRDGSTVRVRPVHVNDAPSLGRFLRGLSPDARRQRFFGTVDPQAAADRMVRADGVDHYGLVAVTGDPPRIVGHAEYLRRPGASVAEAAFAVSDAKQGKGLGTVLLAHLAEHASMVGIEVFEAEVMRGNHRMVGMFRASGFPTEVRTVDGEHRVRFPTTLSPDAVEAFERREAIAASALVGHLLAPDSVAVIGASRRPDSVGGRVLHHLIDGGYPGTIHAVNRNADRVQGLPALRRVSDLPHGVDLAVVAVPAAAVPQVARECGARGVRSMVVLSAGFAEVGGAGAARQAELVRACRATGMRLLGPNCLGVVNTAPGVRMNATFAGTMPPAGNVAMASQSGGLGIALLEDARAYGIGISAFVSLGNKADISGNDLLRHWADDPAVGVVLLYLESFGNPRAFARVATRVSRRVPVVAMKAGRGPAGRRAARSHTGAAMAGPDAVVDALFAKTGVIRAHTLGEMLDVTRLLAAQPPPAGRRVGIITNVGGPGILCADACEDRGLQVVPLEAAVRARLAGIAPPGAALGNPVDLLVDAEPERFGTAVRALTDAGAVDALIALYIQPGLGGDALGVARAVRAAAADAPAVATTLVLLSDADRTAVRVQGEPGGPPVYAAPEAAALALARAAEYAEWRARPAGAVPRFADARPARAAALISRAAAGGERTLDEEEVAELFDAYGLPAPHDPAGGGGGPAVLVGAVADPQFGPAVVCGPGGAAPGIHRDVAVRLTPLTDREAAGMVADPRVARALAPPGGAVPAAVAGALEEVLLRLAAMVHAHPQIAGVECDPVVVSAHGAAIGSARVRVAPAAAPVPWPSVRAAPPG